MTSSNPTNLETLVNGALARPFAAAKARAAEGARVIGYLGADVPAELITAAGAFPLALGGDVESSFIESERYLESSFEPAARAVAEQWLTGALDFMDAIVLPRSNDSAQRLYYYLCELERREPGRDRPRPLLYDLAKIPRASSRAHTFAQTADLARALGANTECLPGAIEERNRCRSLLGRLDEIRRGERPPSGAFVARLSRALDRMPVDAYVEALEAWLETPSEDSGGTRVLLAGSAPPDERLHRAVESAGGCVVAEHGEHAVTRLGSCIDVQGEGHPLMALADHYQALGFGARAFSDQRAVLARRLDEHRIDAGIVWLIEEDEAAVWDLPAQRQAFADAGVPVLVLTRRAWDGHDGALDEIAGFVAKVSGR